MQIFSQNENTSCVDFLQDKSTAVQLYKALPMRASAPVGRALCSFLQSTSSTEVESYRCVIQLANCATMQCADLWCGGKLLIL